MRYDPKTVSAAFQRLFRTYPSFQADAGEDALRVYFEAVGPYETRDIEAAVQSFITGSAPGHNPAFAPSAPMVGAEARRLMNMRLDSEHREKLRQPALPPPDVVHDEESRARVKAMVDDMIQRNADLRRTEEATQKRNDVWAKTNARFNPDADPYAMRKRLGFETGDPEGDADAA